MALSTDIKSMLTANASLYALVADRVYPLIAPERPTLPCIVFTLTSLQTNENKSYANKWDECNVSISAIASTFTAAETIANLVRTAINRYSGTIGSDKIISGNILSQDWEYVPDLAYSGATTGVACFAVNTQVKIITAQNISE